MRILTTSIELAIEPEPRAWKLTAQLTALVCLLGLATIWTGPAASAPTCTGGFSTCLTRCTAQRGGLTGGRDGCAYLCQVMMSRCLRTGCYRHDRCGFIKS
jgi:hypothetical protein